MSEATAPAKALRPKQTDISSTKIFVNLLDLTKDIPETFASVLPLVQRSTLISSILLIIQMTELLAQALPKEIEFGSKIMPIIHDYIVVLNIKQYNDDIRFALIALFASINFCISILLIVLLKIQKPKTRIRERLQIFAKLLSVNVIRIYNPALLIPFLNLSTAELLRTDGAHFLIEKIISAYILLTSLINSFFITNWQNNLTFTIRDHLSVFPGSSNLLRLALIWIASIIFSQNSSVNGTLSLIVFILLLIDYVINIPYNSRFISQLYVCLIMIGILINFSYSMVLHEVFNKGDMDPSLFIALSFPFSFKIGSKFRRQLLLFKIYRTDISAITDSLKLDLLVREIKYSFLENREELKFETQAHIIKFVIDHANACIKPDCGCKAIEFSKRLCWDSLKRFILRKIGDNFKATFGGRWTVGKELSLLNYCAYIVDLEKLPNKALSLMYKNEKKLLSFKSKIMMKIIHNRCKTNTEKKLKSITDNFADFAELIIYEAQGDHLEIINKNFLMRFLEFMVKINQSSREVTQSVYTTFALSRGAELCDDLICLKADIVRLLNKNPESLRILRIALKFNIIFDEDQEFMAIIRRIELRRLMIVREREKLGVEGLGGPDIFNPNAGVIYINMSDYVGRVEKASSSVLRLLNTSRYDLEGHNIANYMPEIIARRHDELLRKFIQSEKSALIREKSVMLFALDKQRYLMTVNLNLRIDTYFDNTFLMSGLLTKSPQAVKALICDEFGNILNFSRELDEDLNLKGIKEYKRNSELNICTLIPQLFWNFYPEEGTEDQLLMDKLEEIPELHVLLITPEDSLNSKSVFGLMNFSILNKGSMNNFTIRSHMLMAETKSISEKIVKETRESAEAVLSKIINNLNKSGEHYILKIHIKVLRFCNGEIKIIYINVLDIKMIEDEEKIENYRNINLRRFFICKQANTTTINEEKLSKDNTSFDEEVSNNMDKSVPSEENVKDSDGQHSPKLKNQIKFNPVKLPNSGSVYSQMRSLLAPQVLVTSNKDNKNLLNVERTSPKKRASFASNDLVESIDKRIPASPTKSKFRRFSLFNSNNNLGQQSSESDASKQTKDKEKSKIEDLFNGNRSEKSTSLSSGSYLSMFSLLDSTKTKEMKFLLYIRVLLIIGFVLIMTINWNYNITSIVSVIENLESSVFLQDLIMPLSLLMKNHLIDDFRSRNMFEDQKAPNDLKEYLGVLQPITKQTMKNALNVRLQEAPFAATFLLKRYIDIIHPTYNLIGTVKRTDLRKSFGIILGYVQNNNTSFSVEEEEAEKEFLLNNYFPFVKEFFFIFDDIIASVNSTMSGVSSVSLLILYILAPSLIIIYLFAFYCAFKIKQDANRLALSLMNFDKTVIGLKVEEVAKVVRDLYPGSLSEIKNVIGDRYPDFLSMKNNETFVERAEKTKSSTNRSRQQTAKSNPVVADNRNKELDRKKSAKYAITDTRVFLWILLFLFTLIFAIQISVFIFNNLLLREFDGKVQKIVMTKEGIQMFAISFTTLITLKHVDYTMQLMPKTDSVSKLRDEIKNYMSYLNQNMVKKSNPSKILDQEDQYPELLQINSHFFFSDICQVLQDNNVFFDFTPRFNSLTCRDVYHGVLKRGVKSLILDISGLLSDWDIKLNSSDDKIKNLKEFVINSEEFACLQFTLNLVKLLEETQIKQVSGVLDNYLNPFHIQEGVWLGVGIGLTLSSFLWVWFLMLRSLNKTYRSSISMLKNFSSKMIAGNKILLARMDQLFKKS